jgi:hypothetical protein
VGRLTSVRLTTVGQQELRSKTNVLKLIVVSLTTQHEDELTMVMLTMVMLTMVMLTMVMLTMVMLTMVMLTMVMLTIVRLTILTASAGDLIMPVDATSASMLCCLTMN